MGNVQVPHACQALTDLPYRHRAYVALRVSRTHHLGSTPVFVYSAPTPPATLQVHYPTLFVFNPYAIRRSVHRSFRAAL